MKDSKIRGVSIHTTGQGLAYYVHYEHIGTKHVDKETYIEAIHALEMWNKKIMKNKEEARAIQL